MGKTRKQNPETPQSTTKPGKGHDAKGNVVQLLHPLTSPSAANTFSKLATPADDSQDEESQASDDEQSQFLKDQVRFQQRMLSAMEAISSRLDAVEHGPGTS